MPIDPSPTSSSSGFSYRALTILVLAGEAIFLLPFVLPRVFRPTLLAVFDLSNLELGTFFSAYGLVAIGAYLLGGPLADRFAPNRLMAVALGLTSLGGVYLASVPPTRSVLVLYATWGMTTILLFWAAMLRATRLAGGAQRQGLAFGILEGGRGLVSALVASLGVWVLGQVFPEGGLDLSPEAQQAGFQAVTLTFSGLVFAAGIATWFGLRHLPGSSTSTAERIDWGQVAQLARKPQLWLLALIILCAYSGYRVLDDVSLLAQDALGYDDVAAARLGGLSLYLRPLAAISAGWLADRYAASRMSIWSFAFMAGGCACIALGPLGETATATVWMAVVLSGLGVYALRGLYFALVDEAHVPLHLTGTAVGLVSMIGYLPDVFMPPLMGYLLDAYSGIQGHRAVYLLGLGFGAVGALAVVGFGLTMRQQRE